MVSLGECRLFHRTLTIDDISKKPNCRNLKFKRAFQFLQLLLIQRVYGIDIIRSSGTRRTSKCCQDEQEQKHNYQVFLGGSCNPTTWRHDQAIPYFQSRSVSYYNPQVPDWTPDLIEIEHRAKELAPLLFFVIDHDTRALASIVEVCYLAACGRNIIVVMNPMPEKNQTKFVQQKNGITEKDDDDDYENVCEARRTLRALLRSINIPVFEDVRLALECAAFILETTRNTVLNNNVFDEENKDDSDVLTPLPNSQNNSKTPRSTPVVLIRSLSNKVTYESTDDFYKQMHQSEATKASPSNLFQQCVSSTPEQSNKNCNEFQAVTDSAKTQLSCSTNESDDDGYVSLSSSNRTLSESSTSLTSELFEPINDQQRDENCSRSSTQSPNSLINNLLSNFYSYIPFARPTNRSESSVSRSLLVLFTLPFRFIKDTVFSVTSPLSSKTTLFSLQDKNAFDTPSSLSCFQTSNYIFDVYVASGEHDEYWLNAFALPSLDKNNLTYTKRQFYHDNDQADVLYDMHLRKHARVLYYLINGSERLSHLAAELAFVIGEHKHKIIVYLQTTIDEDSEYILTKSEQRDIQRSRAYLEDLAQKENIILCHTRQQSWQKVLEFFQQSD